MPWHQHPRFDTALLAVWIVMIAVVRAGLSGDTDPLWQVRDGMELLDGRALAAPDSWSWAPVGGLYYPNSPAWNVLLGIAWRVAGDAGIMALTAVSVTLFLVTAAWLAALAGARRVPTLIAMVAVAILAWPGLGARATMPAQTLVLLALGAGLVWMRRSASRPPWVGAIGLMAIGVALSLIGNWVHVSWASWSIAVAAAWAVMWMLIPGLPRRRALLLGAAGAVGLLGGTLMGPYGLSVRERSSVVFEASRGLITEWTPPWYSEPLLLWMVLAVLALAVAIVAAAWTYRSVWRRAPFEGVPLIAGLLVVAFPSALAGFVAIRFTVVAWLTLLPVCALGLTGVMDRVHGMALRPRPGGARNRLAEYSSDGFWRVIMAACAAVLAPLALIAGAQLGRPPAFEAAALLPRDCRLFSEQADAAGVLLLRPDIRVWFDGRSDYWGRERIEAVYDFLATTEPSRPVPPGTDCVLLRDPLSDAAGAGVGRLLDASAGWVRVGEANGYVVWVPLR